MALTLYRPAALFVSLRRSAVGSLGMGKLGPSKVFIKKCFLPTPLGNPKEHTHTQTDFLLIAHPSLAYHGKMGQIHCSLRCVWPI